MSDRGISGFEKIGVLAAEMMEGIELDDSIEGDVVIGEVAIVVELRGEGWTSIQYLSTEKRRWAQAGLLSEALNSARRAGRRSL